MNCGIYLTSYADEAPRHVYVYLLLPGDPGVSGWRNCYL